MAAGAEHPVVWMGGGARIEVHLRGEDTDGAFCLLVDQLPVGWRLPAHSHRDEDETVHVLEGELEMVLDGVSSRVSAGETIHVPRGVVHTSTNVGARPLRRVVIFSPAGMERFFLEAGSATPDAEVDPAAMLALAKRHGWEFPA